MSSQPKIESLRVRAVCVPMEQPHRTASGTITESPLVLTDIFTDDGAIGHSITFTYTVAALKTTAELIQNLAELIIGEPLAPVGIADAIRTAFPSARDAGARRHGDRGYRYGAFGMLWRGTTTHRSCVCSDARRGRSLRMARLGMTVLRSPRQIAAELGETRISGSEGEARISHRLRKISQLCARSVQRLATRSRLWPTITNRSPPAAAIERLRRLDDEGLTWVEEPVLAHDYQGHAMVAREIRTPIQCGENWWGPHDMREAIEARAS